MKLTNQQIHERLNGWHNDPRMVCLANPGRGLTAKERAEWERGVERYQVRVTVK